MKAYSVSIGGTSYKNGGTTTNLEIFKCPIMAITKFLYLINRTAVDNGTHQDFEILEPGIYKCSCKEDWKTYEMCFDNTESILKYINSIHDDNVKCSKCEDDILIFGFKLREILYKTFNNQSYGGYWFHDINHRLDCINLNTCDTLIVSINDLRA